MWTQTQCPTIIKMFEYSLFSFEYLLEEVAVASFEEGPGDSPRCRGVPRLFLEILLLPCCIGFRAKNELKSKHNARHCDFFLGWLASPNLPSFNLLWLWRLSESLLASHLFCVSMTLPTRASQLPSFLAAHYDICTPWLQCLSIVIWPLLFWGLTFSLLSLSLAVYESLLLSSLSYGHPWTTKKGIPFCFGKWQFFWAVPWALFTGGIFLATWSCPLLWPFVSSSVSVLGVWALVPNLVGGHHSPVHRRTILIVHSCHLPKSLVR